MNVFVVENERAETSWLAAWFGLVSLFGYLLKFKMPFIWYYCRLLIFYFVRVFMIFHISHILKTIWYLLPKAITRYKHFSKNSN